MAQVAESIESSDRLDVGLVSRGYKTEIGLIPADWLSPAIGDVCKLINGRGFKPHEWRTRGIPILRIQNLNGSEEFNHYDGQYDPKIEVLCDQLVFAWSGSRGTSFGPYVWKGPFALLNYHTWKVVHDEEKVDRDFLFHALKSLTQYIESWAHGASALVHVQKWQMEKFKIPLPQTRREQKAIAEILNDADEHISRLEKLIEKKRLLKQGAMQELLLGVRRLPSFSGNWRVDALGEIASANKGTQLTRNDFSEGGKFAHLNGGVAPSGYTDRSNMPRNTIAISEGGNSCGYVQFMTEPFWCGGHCYAVIPNGIDNRFLYHALKSQESSIMRLRVGSGLPNVQKTALLAFGLRYPECGEEQIAIAESLSTMDAEVHALESRLQKARQIKQGMTQEVQTGRVRLV